MDDVRSELHEQRIVNAGADDDDPEAEAETEEDVEKHKVFKNKRGKH